MWCWWCCHPFDNEPLHLPYKYDSIKDVFHTSGIFCSWSCMKAYNISTTRGGRSGIVADNITLMRKRACSKLVPTKAAPNRYMLKVFGGNMEIDEFRKCSEDGNVPVLQMPDEIYKPPEVLVPDESKETKISNKPIDVGERKINAVITNTDVNQPLLIQRKKPLRRHANTLENMLGISKK